VGNRQTVREWRPGRLGAVAASARADHGGQPGQDVTGAVAKTGPALGIGRPKISPLRIVAFALIVGLGQSLRAGVRRQCRPA
jgi:hypothetical protein